MRDYETKNATIKSAEVYIEDHGFLTVSLGLDYGGTFQHFGGYSLGDESGAADAAYCGVFIARCMQVAGVTDWRKMVGKNVRAVATNTEVLKIGHITKDIWFEPGVELKALNNQQENLK